MNAIKGMTLLLGVVVLAGCGGGGKGGGGGASSQTPQSPIIAQGNIGSTGGTVTVTNPASSHYRASIRFDAGVVTTPGQMIIQKPQTPVALVEAPDGLLPIDLRFQGIFSGIATVTITYSETLLGANGVNESEIIVLGEAPNGGFEEMHIVARDTVLNTITFETEHFSTFFAASPVLYAAKYMGLSKFDAFDAATAGFIDPAQPYTFSSFSTLEFPVKNGKQSIKIGKGSLTNFRAGKGRNAVLLHGVLSSSLTWARDGGRDNPNDLYASLIAPQSPYDNVIAYDWPWAVDLETNGKVFAKNMQANINPNGLYDLFGHSAGGLVAQSAIQNHGLSNIQNLVMLGTPNQGSSLSDIATYFSFPEITALLSAKGRNGISDLVSGSSPFLLNLHTSGLSARRGTKYFGVAAGADQWVPVGSVIGIALNDSKIIPNQDHGQVHTNGKNNSAWIYSREWVTGKSNATPIVDAGKDQTVVMNTQVALTGSATDADPGETLTYAWTQTGGPNVTLANANTATASFTPTQADTYTFTLTVSDSLATNTDTVTVTVQQAPIRQTIAPTTKDITIDFNPNSAQSQSYEGLTELPISGSTYTELAFFNLGSGSIQIPATATIVSATLDFSLIQASTSGTIEVRGYNGVLITNGPPSTTSFDITTALGIAGGWYVITGSKLTVRALTGNAKYHASEDTQGRGPRLTITWQ